MQIINALQKSKSFDSKQKYANYLASKRPILVQSHSCVPLVKPTFWFNMEVVNTSDVSSKRLILYGWVTMLSFNLTGLIWFCRYLMAHGLVKESGKSIYFHFFLFFRNFFHKWRVIGGLVFFRSGLCS
jgi:hypothetical protein